ncbi:MAG: AAA family ATPase, partial [Chloroflexi bacterium]|nr:AAA family ATPase [Chloroflexota bacterium]
MYTSFHIKNFRGFEDLTIGPLDRVNLIAGKNNVGKSSLLEALWIHHSPDNPEVLLRTHIHRGLSDIDQLEMISGLFYNFDRLRAIELLASGEWSDTTRHLQVSLKEREVIQLTFTEPESEQSSLDQDSPLDPWLADHEIVLLYTDEYGNRLVTRGHAEVLRIGSRFPRMVFDISRQRGLRRSAAIYLTARQRSSQREDSRRLGQVELARKDKDVVEILKDIEPRLTKLTTISLRSGPVIFGDIGLPELVPISLMGDGMVRLLSL